MDQSADLGAMQFRAISLNEARRTITSDEQH